jgi:hypothetical protein
MQQTSRHLLCAELEVAYDPPIIRPYPTGIGSIIIKRSSFSRIGRENGIGRLIETGNRIVKGCLIEIDRRKGRTGS